MSTCVADYQLNGCGSNAKTKSSLSTCPLRGAGCMTRSKAVWWIDALTLAILGCDGVSLGGCSADRRPSDPGGQKTQTELEGMYQTPEGLSGNRTFSILLNIDILTVHFTVPELVSDGWGNVVITVWCVFNRNTSSSRRWCFRLQ